LMSAGSPDKVGKAKEFITAALTGLVLALFSFLILNTVNPRLTQLQPLQVNSVQSIFPTPLGTKGQQVVTEQQANENLAKLSKDLGIDLGSELTVTAEGMQLKPNAHAVFGAMSEAMLGHRITQVLETASVLAGEDITAYDYNQQTDNSWSVAVTNPTNATQLRAYLEQQRNSGQMFYNSRVSTPFYSYTYDDGTGVWFIPQSDGSVVVQNSFSGSLQDISNSAPGVPNVIYHYFTGQWWN
ncbi:MAG: hypothetical protein WC508_02155, partial [Patescibacteria group bacterium]